MTESVQHTTIPSTIHPLQRASKLSSEALPSSSGSVELNFLAFRSENDETSNTSKAREGQLEISYPILSLDHSHTSLL